MASCSFLIRRLDRCLLRSNQGFNGLALIHRLVPGSHLGKADRRIQDRRGVESTGKHVRKKCGKIGPGRSQSSAYANIGSKHTSERKLSAMR